MLNLIASSSLLNDSFQYHHKTQLWIGSVKWTTRKKVWNTDLTKPKFDQNFCNTDLTQSKFDQKFCNTDLTQSKFDQNFCNTDLTKPKFDQNFCFELLLVIQKLHNGLVFTVKIKKPKTDAI